MNLVKLHRLAWWVSPEFPWLVNAVIRIHLLATTPDTGSVSVCQVWVCRLPAPFPSHPETTNAMETEAGGMFCQGASQLMETWTNPSRKMPLSARLDVIVLSCCLAPYAFTPLSLADPLQVLSIGNKQVFCHNLVILTDYLSRQVRANDIVLPWQPYPRLHIQCLE